ncbi:MAG TPA: helix-turn-helix domain-containing protein [Nocardioides sp.]|nr:helix-turn-helix domain-containing protein [Nocardioides sp.]
MAVADVVLHPHRLRIVQALLGHPGRTTADLRGALPDIPPATLYRHLATLIDADVVAVVEERKVRGAVERTYALGGTAAYVDGAEARTMSVEQHRQAFLVFVSTLLAEFDRYLDGSDVDLERDLVGYRQVPLHLTDEELVQLLGELSSVLLPWAQKSPGPGRRRRIFTTVLMPADPGTTDD